MVLIMKLLKKKEEEKKSSLRALIVQEDKITKLHLEVFLLREEGQTKHLICRIMGVKRGNGGYVYRNKLKYCKKCAVVFQKEKRCPCCGFFLRTTHKQKAHTIYDMERNTHAY